MSSAESAKLPVSSSSLLAYPLLLTDFDGTLTDANWRINTEVRGALHAYVAAGGTVAFASGRSWLGPIQEFVSEMGWSTPSIVSGGARIVTAEGQTLWSRFVDPTVVAQIINLVKGTVGRLCLDQDDRLAVDPETELSWIGPGVKLADLDEWPNQPVYKVLVGAFKDPAMYEQMFQTFSKFAGITVTKTLGRSGPVLDVTCQGADKEMAGRFLLQHLGFSPDQTMFAGDGGNDVPLFQIGGFRAAADYAPAELLSVADAVYDNSAHTMIAELLQEKAYI